jgi:trafficking protein particle complex subunit 10
VGAIPIVFDVSDNHGRCALVAWSSENDNPAMWAELMNKIKDGVISAFDSAVSQREDEVKRSEGQRQMPGWNFCTFFILKVLPRSIIRYSS